MSSNKLRAARYVTNSLACLGAVGLMYCVFATFFGSSTQPVAAQTDRYIESRLTQIEQRFYQLESRLNRVEQDAANRRAGPPSIADTKSQEINLLQNELIGFRLRLGEVECAVLKLDDRTLPASRRMGNRGDTGSDRCRQDWASPVVLSARP